MAFMLVTCPESAHLEEIEYEDDPLGMLIVRCSAFPPGCPMKCARTCAARLDRRRLAKCETAEPMRVLVVRSCLAGVK